MTNDGAAGDNLDASEKDERKDADESSSDDDDEQSFTESRWNAQKASQPVHIRSESEAATARTTEPAGLLEKRIYRLAQPLHEEESTVDTTTSNTSGSTAQHSEVEK